MTGDARRVRLLLLDVDGVLTDGTILLHHDGAESKAFHIRDGAAIVWAQRAGLKVGLLSGRASDATVQRAAQLGIPLVVQGAADKLAAYEQILREAALEDGEVAYMGDDLQDLPVLRRVGFSAAPADAPPRSAPRTLGERAAWRARCRPRADRTSAADPGRLAERRRSLSGAPGILMTSAVLLASLVALLLGLAIGKAWERYKLQDGVWTDRRRARESPHYMLGLNFLVANQIDPAIHELQKAAQVAGEPLRFT